MSWLDRVQQEIAECDGYEPTDPKRGFADYWAAWADQVRKAEKENRCDCGCDGEGCVYD